MSKKNTLNLTLVQTKLVWENRQKNLEQFDQLLKQVKNTDVVMLPEMFTTGFSMDTKRLGESMTGESVQWMKEKARKLKAAVCGSLIIEEKKKYSNRFFRPLHLRSDHSPASQSVPHNSAHTLPQGSR